MVGGAGQELLLVVFLLDYALLHVHRDVNHVIDLEEVRKQSFDLWFFVHAEDIGDDESLPATNLLALNIWCLILLVCRLAQKFADLVQEAVFIAQLTPSFDAQDQVKASFSRKQLRQVDRVRLTRGYISIRGAGDAARELLLDAVVADNGARREELSQELQVVCLPMAHVKDAQAFQTFQAGRPDRCIVVHLQLKDVRSLAHLVKDAHDDALCAEKGVPAILARFPVREDLEVDAICGSGDESEDASAPDFALPGLRLELFGK